MVASSMPGNTAAAQEDRWQVMIFFNPLAQAYTWVADFMLQDGLRRETIRILA